MNCIIRSRATNNKQTKQQTKHHEITTKYQQLFEKMRKRCTVAKIPKFFAQKFGKCRTVAKMGKIADSGILSRKISFAHANLISPSASSQNLKTKSVGRSEKLLESKI